MGCAWLKTPGGRDIQTSASKERRGWKTTLVAQHYELPGNLTYLEGASMFDSKDLGTIDFSVSCREYLMGATSNAAIKVFFLGPEPERWKSFRLHESYGWVLTWHTPLPSLWNSVMQEPVATQTSSCAQLWFCSRRRRFNSHTPTLPVKSLSLPFPELSRNSCRTHGSSFFIFP